MPVNLSSPAGIDVCKLPLGNLQQVVGNWAGESHKSDSQLTELVQNDAN